MGVLLLLAFITGGVVKDHFWSLRMRELWSVKGLILGSLLC